MLKIPPDYTFLIQIAIFVAFWLIAKRLWFDPALRVIAARRERSEGAVEEARAIAAEAQRLRADHAAALEQTRSEAQRELQEIIRGAEAEQKRLVADLLATAEREREQLLERGRLAADRIRADARVLAEQEFAAARTALRDDLIEDAVRQASALLHQALTPGDQQRLVRDFIASARAA